MSPGTPPQICNHIIARPSPPVLIDIGVERSSPFPPTFLLRTLWYRIPSFHTHHRSHANPQTGTPAPSSLPKALPRPITDTTQMDLFFNPFFGSATAETRAELDAESEQVPVESEKNPVSITISCIVA